MEEKIKFFVVLYFRGEKRERDLEPSNFTQDKGSLGYTNLYKSSKAIIILKHMIVQF